MYFIMLHKEAAPYKTKIAYEDVPTFKLYKIMLGIFVFIIDTLTALTYSASPLTQKVMINNVYITQKTIF